MWKSICIQILHMCRGNGHQCRRDLNFLQALLQAIFLSKKKKRFFMKQIIFGGCQRRWFLLPTQIRHVFTGIYLLNNYDHIYIYLFIYICNIYRRKNKYIYIYTYICCFIDPRKHSGNVKDPSVLCCYRRFRNSEGLTPIRVEPY